jgi:hypothetical protein
MTITMGDLVSTLFEVYDDELHDQHLAAVATQVRLNELLSQRARPQQRRATLKAA